MSQKTLIVEVGMRYEKPIRDGSQLILTVGRHDFFMRVRITEFAAFLEPMLLSVDRRYAHYPG